MVSKPAVGERPYWESLNAALDQLEQDRIDGDDGLQNQINTKATGLNGVTGFWQGTQDEYDAIATPDPDVVYLVDSDGGEGIGGALQIILRDLDDNPVPTKFLKAIITEDNQIDDFVVEEF